MFWAIYLFVFFAALAMMVREGLWSNSIKLVEIVLSGLVAYGLYSPLVIYLDELMDGSATYWLDFAVIWGLFVVTVVVTRLISGVASGTRMRFRHPIDPFGGPILAAVAAWVMAGFVMATLHTSPMPREAFGGGLVSANDVASASALTAPDAAWLRFVERVAGPRGFGPPDKKVFGAIAFVRIYGDRREKFSESGAKWLTVKR